MLTTPSGIGNGDWFLLGTVRQKTVSQIGIPEDCASSTEDHNTCAGPITDTDDNGQGGPKIYKAGDLGKVTRHRWSPKRVLQNSSATQTPLIVERLTSLYNDILRWKELPKDWTRCVLTILYKNKLETSSTSRITAHCP